MHAAYTWSGNATDRMLFAILSTKQLFDNSN